MSILSRIFVVLFVVSLAACNGGSSGEDPVPAQTSDIDGDGIVDSEDPDIDGDGRNNDQDAFPNDKDEWADLDGDGTGDNSDPDRDGDSRNNDVDAFPDDKDEWSDLDGDGTGDNSDPDRDGDTRNNDQDAFPDNKDEWADLDGDGTGDNSDPDRDGDTYNNDSDVFPDDKDEWADLDGDGAGDNSDPDIDGDGLLNDDDPEPRVPLIAVSIDQPASLITVASSPITVVGSSPNPDATITVNGQTVTLTDGAFTTQVAIQEGHNVIEVRALKNNLVATDTISVSLDATPPNVTVESHVDGETVSEADVTITGLINDIVRGTIEEDQAQVTVNGVEASISNRSYSANLTLTEGSNTIEVIGVDQVGNSASVSFSLTYEKPTGRRLVVKSGRSQEAIITSVLDSPLQVQVLDENEQPVSEETVVFRVIQGAGNVGADETNEGRAVIVETDQDGLAQTKFRLGYRVGVDNHKVRAAVVGFENEVVFAASATSEIGNKLSVNSGNNQRGSVGQVLPEPFVVVVTDNGANVVKDARVEFSVVSGGGQFKDSEGQKVETLTVVTDSDGRATAEYILGSVVGIDAQRVSALLLDGPEGETINAGFTATAFVPADPGETKISGVVLDNQDLPIPGVTVRVDGTVRQAVTDDEGQFEITQVPVGPVHLVADGSTATVPGEFPSLAYNLVTISGVDNPLSAPIYMVKLNTENAVAVGAEYAVLELAEYPGFKLEIAKDSVTFPDGATEGLISVTSVNASKVPMAPPNGMQPQFIVTIQPTGTRFDPPARLSLPNVDAHAAGAQVEMYSFDHDLEEFVSIGLGTVNEDGTVITSNPGVGVVKAGWHCGSQPAGQGCCGGSNGNNKGCPKCYNREGDNCNAGDCKPDDTQDPGEPCKKCSGGNIVNDDSKKPEGKDATCKKCENGEAVSDTNSNGLKCSEKATEFCYTCKNGSCGNNCDANPDKEQFTLKTGDLAGLGEIVDKIKYAKFPPFEVSDAGASLTLSGTRETGEKCCGLCSEGQPEKSQYTKYEGSYKFEAFIKIGFVGTSGGVYEWIGWTDYRLGLAYEIGPFLTVKGALGNSISYTQSECEEGNCLTVGVKGELGAQVDVGGSVRVGYDKWNYEECVRSRQSTEVDNARSPCFHKFKGVKAELWATGGSIVSAEIAISDCPTEDKCELVLGKTEGKVFYKATVDLGFFSWNKEDVLVKGTFAEGGKYSCK